MADAVIDDLSRPFPLTPRGTRWAVVSDRVMGGVSSGRLGPGAWQGRACLHLTGEVSLANDGGFLQAALDLSPGGATVDASGRAGIAITVAGPAEDYALHLRTTDLARPWQSYRAGFAVTPDWTVHRLPWSAFMAHRTAAPFAPSRLRRIGVIAIGRAFRADLMVADLRFYGADGGS